MWPDNAQGPTITFPRNGLDHSLWKGLWRPLRQVWSMKRKPSHCLGITTLTTTRDLDHEPWDVFWSCFSNVGGYGAWATMWTLPHHTTRVFTTLGGHHEPWWHSWWQGKATREGSETRHPFTSPFTTRSEDHEPWERLWDWHGLVRGSQVKETAESKTKGTTMSRCALYVSSTREWSLLSFNQGKTTFPSYCAKSTSSTMTCGVNHGLSEPLWTWIGLGRVFKV